MVGVEVLAATTTLPALLCRAWIDRRLSVGIPLHDRLKEPLINMVLSRAYNGRFAARCSLLARAESRFKLFLVLPDTALRLLSLNASIVSINDCLVALKLREKHTEWLYLRPSFLDDLQRSADRVVFDLDEVSCNEAHSKIVPRVAVDKYVRAIAPYGRFHELGYRVEVLRNVFCRLLRQVQAQVNELLGVHRHQILP